MTTTLEKFKGIATNIRDNVDNGIPLKKEKEFGYINLGFKTVDEIKSKSKFVSIDTIRYIVNGEFIYKYNVEKKNYVIYFYNLIKKKKLIQNSPIKLLKEVKKRFDSFPKSGKQAKLNVPEFTIDIFSDRIFKYNHNNNPILYVKPFSFNRNGINTIGLSKKELKFVKSDTLKNEFGVHITYNTEKWFGVVKRPGENVGLFGRKSR